MAIKFESGYDRNGKYVLIAKKSRGKITIPELREALSSDYKLAGWYAVIVQANEGCLDPGWGYDGEPKGDAVCLYELTDGDSCPVCQAVTPSFEYCPHCGEEINKKRKCRVCGCTQERACPGGCWWVEYDLCSACVGKEQQ